MQLHGDKFADYLAGQGITEQKVRNVVEKIRGGQKSRPRTRRQLSITWENTEPIWFKLPVIIN